MLEGFLTVGRAITDHNRHRLLTGDSLQVLKDFADNSVDACVTDPPYGLSNHKTQDVVACLTAWLQNEPFKPKKVGFMSQNWDSWVPGPEIWREVYRVLKPGGHALVFAGTRSMDLMCMALRLAGFEVRDSIGFAHDDTRDAAPLLGWTFGSGFPKSQDVSKAIDKALGAKRDKVKTPMGRTGNKYAKGLGAPMPWMLKAAIAGFHEHDSSKPATLDAEKWEGFGTALKPAHEPVIIARKPLDVGSELAVLHEVIYSLGGRLWSMLSASAAKQYFGSNLHELNEAFGFAPWRADKKFSTQGDLCEEMGTSQFELATAMSLSTVLSWLRTLDAILKHGSTSITKMVSDMTINLETLKFLAYKITPGTIIQAHKSGAWQSADACIAARNLNATVAMLNATLELFVLAPATSQWRRNSRAGGDKELAPNFEPIILVRKPLGEKTVARNVLKHGTGALNIDGCRIGTQGEKVTPTFRSDLQASEGWSRPWMKDTNKTRMRQEASFAKLEAQGRFPANLIHDGSTAVTSLFPDTGKSTGGQASLGAFRSGGIYGKGRDETEKRDPGFGDSGSAARFFYCAKASSKDRNEGIERLTTWEKEALDRALIQGTLRLKAMLENTTYRLEDFDYGTMLSGKIGTARYQKGTTYIIKTALKLTTDLQILNFCLNSTIKENILDVTKTFLENGLNLVESVESVSQLIQNTTNEKTAFHLGVVLAVLKMLQEIKDSERRGNSHSTVKPTALMRYLVRLVTPPGGLVLDPFAGSGSTGKAAVLEGFDFVGIEQSPEYARIARERIRAARKAKKGRQA